MGHFIKIINSTSYFAKGVIFPQGYICGEVNYQVAPNATWKSENPVSFLINKISATVKTPSGDIDATPYSCPSGGFCQQFTIVETGNNSFKVSIELEENQDAITEV